MRKVFRLSGCLLAGFGLIFASSVANAACAVPTLDNSLSLSATYSHSSAYSGEFRAVASPESRPNTNTSGDTQLRPLMCQQSIIDQLWDHYNMDEGDWNDGRGFDDACNEQKMLGRTFIGLTVLNWSTPNPPSNWDDMSGNALRWGGNYAASRIDELDGRCNWNGACNPGGCTLGLTQTGGIFVDEWTQVFKGFTYQLSPVSRAATILHESRHADGFSHDGDDGTNACNAHGSCDESYSDAVSAARADSFESWYTQWYLFEAVNTSTTQKRSAQRFNNWALSNRFDNPPGFIMNADSGRVSCGTAAQCRAATPSTTI